MRSMKLLAVSTTVLACVTVAGVSSADDTTAPPTTGVGGAQPAQTTTQTTQTTLDAPGTMSPAPSSPSSPPSGVVAPTPVGPPPAATPSSTTTITQAEMMPPASPPPTAESTTVYKKKVPNTALLVTGAALFASTYVTTAAITASEGRPNGVDDHLYIPIAGPWVNIARTDHDTGDNVLIVGSGILQGIGAGLFISSFFVPEKIEAARINAGPVKMKVTPTTYTGGAGIGAVGTF